MSDAELAVFESSSFAAAAVRVRRWDDGGKIVGMVTRTLGDFLELVGRQLQRTKPGIEGVTVSNFSLFLAATPVALGCAGVVKKGDDHD